MGVTAKRNMRRLQRYRQKRARIRLERADQVPVGKLCFHLNPEFPIYCFFVFFVVFFKH